MRQFLVAASLAAGLLAAPLAQAATIDFTGQALGVHPGGVTIGQYTLDGVVVTNGNCPYNTTTDPTTPCVRFDPPLEGSILSATGRFDLLGLTLRLQSTTRPANGITFEGLDSLGDVVASAFIYIGFGAGDIGDGSVSDGPVPIAAQMDYSLVFGSAFLGIASLRLSSTDPDANVRLDDIVLRLTPVPLPAAGLMLLAGLAGLAALRRRA